MQLINLDAKDTELLKQLKETADRIELKAISFLDDAGSVSRRYTRIVLEFHDGTKLELPKRLESHFEKQQFNLRKARDDA